MLLAIAERTCGKSGEGDGSAPNAAVAFPIFSASPMTPNTLNQIRDMIAPLMPRRCAVCGDDATEVVAMNLGSLVVAVVPHCGHHTEYEINEAASGYVATDCQDDEDGDPLVGV